MVCSWNNVVTACLRPHHLRHQAHVRWHSHVSAVDAAEQKFLFREQ